MSRDGLERSTQRGAVTGNAVPGPGAPIQRIQVGPPKSHQLSHFSRSSVLPGSVAGGHGLGQLGHRGHGAAVALHVEPAAGLVSNSTPSGPRTVQGTRLAVVRAHHQK